MRGYLPLCPSVLSSPLSIYRTGKCTTTWRTSWRARILPPCPITTSQRSFTGQQSPPHPPIWYTRIFQRKIHRKISFLLLCPVNRSRQQPRAARPSPSSRWLRSSPEGCRGSGRKSFGVDIWIFKHPVVCKLLVTKRLMVTKHTDLCWFLQSWSLFLLPSAETRPRKQAAPTALLTRISYFICVKIWLMNRW